MSYCGIDQFEAVLQVVAKPQKVLLKTRRVDPDSLTDIFRQFIYSY